MELRRLLEKNAVGILVRTPCHVSSSGRAGASSKKELVLETGKSLGGNHMMRCVAGKNFRRVAD